MVGGGVEGIGIKSDWSWEVRAQEERSVEVGKMRRKGKKEANRMCRKTYEGRKRSMHGSVT